MENVKTSGTAMFLIYMRECCQYNIHDVWSKEKRQRGNGFMKREEGGREGGREGGGSEEGREGGRGGEGERGGKEVEGEGERQKGGMKKVRGGEEGEK